MRTFSTVFAATAFVLTAEVSALAQCGPTVQVGTLIGDPEKDTVGLLCRTSNVTRTSSVTSMLQGEIVQIGSRTGEAEKDTAGYLHPAAAR